jgi:hypothetical protein
VRNVPGIVANAIHKALLATSQEIIVEKAVKSAAVRYELGQAFIALNAN